MATPPSCLSGVIADEEDLTRFITQSNHFNAIMAKPAAFLPNPKYRNTSMFRCAPDPELIRRKWQAINQSDRTLKIAAVLKTLEVRKAGLFAVAKEPSDAHANLEGWPWLDQDTELQKAEQLKLAQAIAQKSTLIAV